MAGEPLEFGLRSAVLAAMRGVFAAHPPVQRVTLYGSRAKGTARPASDIDLTIEGDGVNFSELLKIENELDDLLLPWMIDLSLLRQIENPALRDHITRVGQPFYIRQQPRQ